MSSPKKFGINKISRKQPTQSNRKSMDSNFDYESEDEKHFILPGVDYEEYLSADTTLDFEDWKLQLFGHYKEKPQDSSKSPQSFSC